MFIEIARKKGQSSGGTEYYSEIICRSSGTRSFNYQNSYKYDVPNGTKSKLQTCV